MAKKIVRGTAYNISDSPFGELDIAQANAEAQEAMKGTARQQDNLRRSRKTAMNGQVDK